MDKEMKEKADGFLKLSQDEMTRISGGFLNDKAKAFLENFFRNMKEKGQSKEEAYSAFHYKEEICAYIDEIWDTL